MSNYKGLSTLEEYIQQCDRTNAWAWATADPGEAAAAPSAKPLAKPPAVLGLKRPLHAVATPSAAAVVMDPSKRPRLTYGQGGATTISPAAKAGPKQPAVAPPMGSILRGTAAIRLASPSTAKPTAHSAVGTAPAAGPARGGAPAWAAKPGSYGTGSYGSSPAVGRPAAPKPASHLTATVKPTNGTRPAGFGQPGQGKPPPLSKPGGSFMRPAPKVGPPKAKAGDKPGALIRSLLNAA